MPNEIASAYVSIYPKTIGFGDAVNQAVGNSAKAASTKSIAVGSAIGGLISRGISSVAGAISGSIGSAIGRVDTIEGFSTVMENLGYDSDVASRKIKQISDALQGLPTTTDFMVGMVQQLAASVGDLEEATDLGIAFNDMMVAAGANSEVTARAFDQYNKMLSAGKVNLDSWTTLQAAMPGQLQQVAQEMLGAGASSMDLYNALKHGEVGLDDFNATLVRLDQQGGESITSFRDAALENAGGIDTSMTNMETAITRGMANVIQALGSDNIIWFFDFLKAGIDAAFSAITPLVEKIGEFVGGMIEGKDPIEAMGAVLDATFGRVVESVAPMVGFLADAIGRAAEAADPWLLEAITALGGFLLDVFSAAVNAVIFVVMLFLDAFTSTVDFIRNAPAAIGEAVETIKSNITSTFENLVSSALSWGSDLIDNIVSGIKNAIGSVKDAVSSVASTIAEFLHFSEPDVGPLSDFHTFMPDMIDLMAKGIRDNVGKIEDEAYRVASILDFGSNSNEFTVRTERAGMGGIVIQNLNVSASDYKTAEQFVTMIRRAAMQYA